MQLCDIYLGLGEDSFQQLLRSISMGKLKTYQIFDRVKMRAHLAKLNSETLRKSSPRLWARLGEADGDLATDLAQAILVSHLDMIVDVLALLGVPNEDGFFAKDMDASAYLTEGWQQKAFDHFNGKYTPALLLFYINHLEQELNKDATLFAPAAQA
ncbi:MAG: hypothetical protein ABI693_02870 [Bryobacteraceae bacterium]